MTDRVVLRSDADLLAARPLIASAVSGIVGGGAFRSLFRHAVLDAHRAIFYKRGDLFRVVEELNRVRAP